MEMQRVRGLGLHLVFTLTGCRRDRLEDYRLIYNLLRHVPLRIGMHLIDVPGNPWLSECCSPRNELNHGLSGMSAVGYTGFSLLEDSHVAIHTWPEELTLDCDVFSCWPFDWRRALRMIALFFRGVPVNVRVVERGDNGEVFDMREMTCRGK